MKYPDSSNEMKQQQWAHRQEIKHYLEKMHLSPEHLQAYQILQGKSSGAAIYRLQMMGEELILKVSRMESERNVRERARRELSCYQILVPRLPLCVPHILAHVRDAQAIALLLRAYVSRRSLTLRRYWAHEYLVTPKLPKSVAKPLWLNLRLTVPSPGVMSSGPIQAPLHET